MTAMVLNQYDTVPLFVYIDQLLCHCIFICSDVHRRQTGL